MGLFLTSSSILPGTCTASTWKGMPLALTISPASRTGKTTPVSLLAYMIETMAVSFERESRSSSRSSMPSSFTPSQVTR